MNTIQTSCIIYNKNAIILYLTVSRATHGSSYVQRAKCTNIIV